MEIHEKLNCSNTDTVPFKSRLEFRMTTVSVHMVCFLVKTCQVFNQNEMVEQKYNRIKELRAIKNNQIFDVTTHGREMVEKLGKSRS